MLIEIHQESDSSVLSMKSGDLGNTNLDRTTNIVELPTRFGMIITDKHAGHLVRKKCLGVSGNRFRSSNFEGNN